MNSNVGDSLKLELEIIGEHLLTSDEKLERWGYGEWIEEPDMVDFIHKGISCKCLREINLNKKNHCGYWIGMVYVYEYPSWAKKIVVHGGLNFIKPRLGLEYSIEFSCDYKDLCPSDKTNEYLLTYKNIKFVMDETKNLAEQVAKLIKTDL